MRTMLLCGAAVLGLADVASAQQVDDNVVEEVVVTAPNYVPTTNTSATKVDVPLIETPQSITVITRDQIDLQNWTNLQQAVRYTSGVIGENFGSDERYDWITQRGFQPVQYIDGLQAPIGSVTNVGLDLWGADSIEILKGPSGVLYGQTPPGGIVNLTMRRPQTEFGGELQAQYGSYEHKQVAGDVTGPLGDMVSARLTGLWRDRETQTDGVTSKRAYIAPAFKIQFTPDTELTLLAYYQKDKVEGDGGGFLPAFGTLLPNPLGEVPAERNIGDFNYNVFDRTQWAVGYEFSHRFNEMFSIHQNLKHSEADSYSQSVYGAGLVDNDFNGVPDDYRTVNRYNFLYDEKIKQIAVDTRVELEMDTGAVHHTALAGLDYRNLENVSDFGFTLGPPIDLFNPDNTQTIVKPALFPFLDQELKQTGVYVQDAMKIGNWRVTLSGRKDWLDNAGVEDDAFTWRAGVNYIFDNGIAPYVVYATSFQPLAGADFNGKLFEPSKGKQIEAGVKVEPRWVPRGYKIFATAAIYDLKQDNVLISDPDHAFFQIQAGEVHVQGLELEAVARIRERLTFNGSYSFTDAESTAGGQLSPIPKHKASAFVDYTIQEGGFAGFGAGAGVRYIGRNFGDDVNTIDFENKSQLLVDAMVHYNWKDWKFVLNATNLFDETYVQRCSSYTQCFFATKRQVYFTVGRKF